MILSWGTRLCYLTLHYSNGRKQGRQIDPHISTDVFYLNKLLNFISILNWIFGIKWRRACPMCPGAPWVIICRAFSVLNRHLHYLLSLLSTGIYMVRWGPPRPLSRLGSAGTGIVMFRTPDVKCRSRVFTINVWKLPYLHGISLADKLVFMRILFADQTSIVSDTFLNKHST